VLERFSKIAVISPHLDDAPLCLGGILSEISGVVDVDVFNVFSISNYTACGIRDTEETSRTRKREESDMAKRIGYHPFFLDYLDAIIRIGQNENDFINPDYHPRSDPIYDELSERLGKTILESRYSQAFFPLGIGYHVDHMLLFQIGLRLHEMGAPISFYEDV
jgi:LmbE family N-acetylglucosaminyl deacetylase